MLITCPQCGCQIDKKAGEVNRAKAAGRPLYCGRECSGLGRRHDTRTPEQKKADKAVYDAHRRAREGDRLKAKKRQHHKDTYDPVKAAEYRQKRMPYHVEYCRRPEYVAQKREYDREYRAKQEYGEFWESALLILDIHRECLAKAGSAYELRKARGYYERTSQQRRRAYERLDSEEPETGPLGNLEFGERR